MNPDHVLDRWIRPTLDYIGLGGNWADQLLLGTAIAEMRLEFLHQIGGPGRGICSVEPDTHTDVMRFLGMRKKKKFLDKILEVRPDWRKGHDALYDPCYCIAIARARYLYTPEPLPRSLDAAAKYWKAHFNTSKGAGTVQHYIDAWDAAH